MEVRQFHFRTWTDMGAPWNALPLLEMMRRVDELRGPDLPSDPQPPPLVVHCSAGVGRTGTYIAVDANMRLLREVARFQQSEVGTVGLVNVLDYLSQIRAQRRPGLVQCHQQFSFVHMALVEFVKAHGLRSLSRQELLQLLAQERSGAGGGALSSSTPPRPEHVSILMNSSPCVDPQLPSRITNSSNSPVSTPSKTGANGTTRASLDNQSKWSLKQQFDVRKHLLYFVFINTLSIHTQRIDTTYTTTKFSVLYLYQYYLYLLVSICLSATLMLKFSNTKMIDLN